MESADTPRHLKPRRRHLRNLATQADIEQVPALDRRDHVTQFREPTAQDMLAIFPIIIDAGKIIAVFIMRSPDKLAGVAQTI